MNLIPRLLITLFLVAAAVPLAALQQGSAAPDKQQSQQSQSQAPGKGPDNKLRKVRKPLRDQYIVVLNDDTRPEDVEFVANQLLTRHRGNTRSVYKHTIKGFSIQMTEDEAMSLSQEPAVAYVQENGIISASTTQNNPPSWGLDRIDQRNRPLNNTYHFANVTTGAGVHAYIIDSGINILHQEFRNASGFTRASTDANFVWFEDGNDCAGHGTMVASVVGGNTLGVAKDVRLHSVKVLDCNGSGSSWGVADGVEWVTDNHIKPAIVNMSLGGDTDYVVEDAIRASMAQKGIEYVVAAGNDNEDAKDTSPARMPEVITVGATTSTDTRALWSGGHGSNWGPALDLFAPGDQITVASRLDENGDGVFNDTTPNPVNGTSFSAPHVAGVLARFLQTQPNVTPAVLQGVIKNLATPDLVQDRGQGSPNLLLYSEVHAAFVRQVTAPPINEFDTNLDSGIDLGPNEFLAITGTGMINPGFPYGDNGPEGWNSIDNNSALPLPGTRPFSLLGILDGQKFYIGRSAATTETFTTNKRLFLRTNDDVPGNGTGAFNAQMQAWKPLPDALSNFVSQSVPKTMLLPGETMNVSITMRNVGPTTWTAGQAFRLGAMGSEGWGVGGRAFLPADVPPNTDVTFNFTVAAPNTPGTFSFRWRMLQEGVQFFGDATTDMPITVLSWSNNAAYVTQSVPTTMLAGESYNVSVTMRNTGNTTWPAGSTFKLGSQNPQDNMNWGLNRVVLTQSVAPGAQVTFNFTVSAPGPGKWNFQWRMVQEGVEWFGAPSDIRQVTVKLPPCVRC